MKTSRYHELEDIPQGNYEGYIWLSDQEKPEIISSENVLDIEKYNDTNDAFVVEGLLYDKQNDTSYHILFTHRYVITRFEIENNDIIKNKTYLSHRLDTRKLNFAEVWEEKKDENCEDFPTLVMTAQVFRGFSNTKND